MCAIEVNHVRLDRWSSVLVGAVSLVLAACSGDGPTAVGTNNVDLPSMSFTVTADAFNAAAMSTNRLIKPFPTLQILTAAQGSQGSRQSSASLVNSPWDLTFSGGPVVHRATSRNIYVNCASTAASCWGTGALSPTTFQHDLNTSGLLQLADQYLGEDAGGRFGTVQELTTTRTFANHTATLNDIFAILFAASNATKASGYDNIYHVFLPNGTDMCRSATNCYSPDAPQNFVFCAFHGSVDFGPHWHVLFSVEPYQFVGGCALPNQTRVIDGTASTLSHEFFETITDPDLDAWFSFLSGNEIGDLCFGFRNSEHLTNHDYVVQEEYSNTVHNCTDGSF